MKESLETFVRSKRNAPVFDALEGLREPFPAPVRLFVHGPRHSSKSTFARSVANDAANAQPEGEGVFVCSGADIAIALQFEADDSFFDRLGSAPLVIVDDPLPLLAAEKGALLLALMLDQRDRIGASTVVLSDSPFEDLDFAVAQEAMGRFDRIEFAPLDDSERISFVRTAEAQYRNENSPQVDDEAVEYIVSTMGGSFFDMENAIRYLMTDEDCAARRRIDEAAARELFCK